MLAACYWISSLTKVQAKVIISEVYPAPDTGEAEWVELYNTASTSADVSNWVLSDTLTTPSILHQFVNFVLGPYEVFVLNLSGSKLNNTGDAVVLTDPAASYSATLAYPSTTKGLSWHLDVPTATVYQASPSAGVVVASAPATPEPAPLASEAAVPATPSANLTKPLVTLSEIMACPKSGQPEWLELYNAGTTLQIENWLVTDATGNSRLLSGTIPTTSFVIFSWSSSMLNNTGDSLSITSNLGVVIDQASYSYCQSGYSLSLVGSAWLPSYATPNEKNVLIQEEEAAEPEPARSSTTTPTANQNKQVTPATSAIAGSVLGATTRSQVPYPYVLADITVITPATQSTVVAQGIHAEQVPQPKSKSFLPSGILGGLLLVISSLYAREKPFAS